MTKIVVYVELHRMFEVTFNMLKRIIWCLGITMLFPNLCSAGPLEWLNGNWAVDLEETRRVFPDEIEIVRAEQCHNDYHIIEVRDFGTRVRFTQRNDTGDYTGRDSIVGEITDDYLEIICNRDYEDQKCTELDWYIYFNNPDEHVWVRSDWMGEDGVPTQSTVPRIRCSEPLT